MYAEVASAIRSQTVNKNDYRAVYTMQGKDMDY